MTEKTDVERFMREFNKLVDSYMYTDMCKEMGRILNMEAIKLENSKTKDKNLKKAYMKVATDLKIMARDWFDRSHDYA